MQYDREISICKADPTGNQLIGDVVISITDKLPDLTGDLKEAAAFYKGQAESIEIALFYSLPGGVYDQLLCKMMQRRASLFCVPFGEQCD